jgi:hypothetical protein
LPLSAILLLDFSTVPTVCYFLFAFYFISVKILHTLKTIVNVFMPAYLGLVLLCFTPLLAVFQLYRGGQFH